MSSLPSMSNFVAGYVDQLLRDTAAAIEDLSVEELHFRVHHNTNSVGFDAWHVARTADNIVNFAFERKQPVWLAENLNEEWGLPKADQGTGMDPDIAHGLRFPEAKLLAKYARDVAENVVPQIKAMSDDYLSTTTTIRPHGELSKLDIITRVLIVHCNNHLGHINIARTAQGKTGLGF